MYFSFVPTLYVYHPSSFTPCSFIAKAKQRKYPGCFLSCCKEEEEEEEEEHDDVYSYRKFIANHYQNK
jgi:hypothetical protein